MFSDVMLHLCVCFFRYQRQMSQFKTSQHLNVPSTVQTHQKVIAGVSHNANYDTASQSTNVRHQYFILDRDAAERGSVANS
jgi:hypothetical protein